MTCLLDTHFLIWILTESKRTKAFPWLEGYKPWGVSPVSVLEIQFLAEIGRLEARTPDLAEALKHDSRFVVDEVGLVPLVEKALRLEWTRDPFDRLLVAHSLVRRTAICTVDRLLVRQHALIVPELKSG